MRFIFLLVVCLLPACLGVAASAETEPRVELDPMKVTPMPAPILKIADHPILEPRYGAAVVAQDHYLYVIGGSNEAGTRLDTIERIDLESGQTELWGRLKLARRHHRAVIVGDRIYVLGGTSGMAGGLAGEVSDHPGDDPLIDEEPEKAGVPPSFFDLKSIDYESTMEVVDLVSRKVTFGPHMPVAKALFGCVVVDGKILVIGGQKKKGETLFCTNTTEVFDPVSGKWEPGINMPTPRRCVATVVDGFVVVVGGYNGHKPLKVVEIFRPHQKAWHRLPPVAEAINPSASAWLGSFIFFFGDQGMSSRQLVYDLRAKRLVPYPLPLPDSEFAAALAHQDKLYIVGGGDLRTHDATAGIQVFVPLPEPAGSLGASR